MTLLRSLQSEWEAPWDLVRDPQAFEALFVRQTAGPQIDGTSVDGATPLADGSELVFGAGRHDFDVGRLQTAGVPAKAKRPWG